MEHFSNKRNIRIKGRGKYSGYIIVDIKDRKIDQEYMKYTQILIRANPGELILDYSAFSPNTSTLNLTSSNHTNHYPFPLQFLWTQVVPLILRRF